MNLTGNDDSMQIKPYDDQSLDQDRSAIELAIISTPHRRPFATEIMQLILDHVAQPDRYTCTLVSKQFNTIANPLLWNAPQLQSKATVDKFLVGVAESSRMGMMGQHIRKLDMMGDFWTDTHLLLLMPYLFLLEHFAIHNKTDITNESLQHLFRHCPHLISLRLDRHDGLTYSTVHAFAHHCPQLRELILVSCPTLPLATLALLGTRRLTKLCLFFHHQHCLTTDMVRAFATWDTLTDVLLANVTEPITKQLMATNSWPLLTTFYVFDCHGIDDATLIPFLQSHPSLSRLHLGPSCENTDASLDAIATCLPALTVLTLTLHRYLSSSTAIRRLVARCPALTLLTLEHSTRRTLDDFPEVSEHPGATAIFTQKALDEIRCAGIY
ncbi:unnamed protein product [Absidia cylindrospora]